MKPGWPTLLIGAAIIAVAMLVGFRERRAAAQPVSPADVDRFEAMANDLIRHLLNTPPDDLLVLTPRPGYRFQFNDLYGGRGDIINRDLPQRPASANQH